MEGIGPGKDLEWRNTRRRNSFLLQIIHHSPCLTIPIQVGKLQLRLRKIQTYKFFEIGMSIKRMEEAYECLRQSVVTTTELGISPKDMRYFCDEKGINSGAVRWLGGSASLITAWTEEEVQGWVCDPKWARLFNSVEIWHPTAYQSVTWMRIHCFRYPLVAWDWDSILNFGKKLGKV